MNKAKLRVSKVVLVAMVLCTGAETARAQTLTATRGKTIRLQLPDHRLVGTLTTVRSDTIYLRKVMDGPITSIARAEIQSLEVRTRGEHLGRRILTGALIGAVITGAGGLLLSYNLQQCSDCPQITTNKRVLGTALFAGGGLVLGGVVAFLTNPGRWIPAELR